MNHPFIRFIAAIILTVLTSYLIKVTCLLCFGLTVCFITDFRIKTIIFTIFATSLGSTILFFLVPLLLVALHWAGNGSKWISALPILMFISDFIDDCRFLFSGICHNANLMEVSTILREQAGDFYTIGASLTAIIMFVSYVAAGAALLYKEN